MERNNTNQAAEGIDLILRKTKYVVGWFLWKTAQTEQVII